MKRHQVCSSVVSVMLYTELALGQAFFILAFLYVSSMTCIDL